MVQQAVVAFIEITEPGVNAGADVADDGDGPVVTVTVVALAVAVAVAPAVVPAVVPAAVADRVAVAAADVLPCTVTFCASAVLTMG